MSIVMLLPATTKFRKREADASLGGAIDLQVLFELGMFALIGIGIVAAVIAWAPRLRLSKVETLISCYVPIALLSVLWSRAPELTVVRGGQLLIIALLAMVAVRMLGPSKALRTPCIAAGAFAMVAAPVGGVFPWLEADYLGDRVRFSWFAVHPIEVGTLAAIAALGLIGAILWPRTDEDRPARWTWFYYVAAMASLVVLVLSNSRGPLLAFVAGLGVMVLFRLPAQVRPLAVTAGAIPLVLLLVGGSQLIDFVQSVTSHDGVVSQFLLQGQDAEDVVGMNGRMDLWYTIRPDLEQHGVLGYGYHASRSVLMQSAFWTPAYAHNALLQSLLDLGIVGTIPLFAIVAVALTALFRSRLAPDVRGITAALAVFLVLNSISTESFAGAPALDVLMLCICALCARS
jgi:O-antigen ligase